MQDRTVLTRVNLKVPKKNPATQPFEAALAELESVVVSLERGELSLEDSLETFERGVELTRICQEALKQAEQKIQILSEKKADGKLEPFNSGN